jgi:hypothetical protein
MMILSSFSIARASLSVARCLAICAVCAFGASACSSSNHPAAASSKSGHDAGKADATDAMVPADAAATDAATIAFEPVAPASYVAKVKNLLVAQPPTDDEIMRVQNDPSQLKDLIGGWMKQPQYTDKLERFFELAFQQTQVTAEDFSDQNYPNRIGVNAVTIPLLVQNAKQSFARTMVSLVGAGKPLTLGITTKQLMMTTALKEFYAFLDAREIDDAGKVTDHFHQDNPKLNITVSTSSGPIPLADSIDPSNANYMHWYNPDLATSNSGLAGCSDDPYVAPSNANFLHFLLYGSIDNHKSAQGTACPAVRGSANAPIIQTSDFSDWQMVTIREPKAGEATTAFYDLATLRNANELVLKTPRVGFFTTPAFFANWQTNTSNQMRVTLNQALIVGLGSSIDGTDTTQVPNPPPGLDAAHAGAPECVFCHQTLDPLRSIFAATYSWNYHNQLDSAYTAQKGLFAFQGVVTNVSTMSDFATQLSTHPRFAGAWVQKLCYYANSAACLETDPEFQRIVQVFSDSSYSFNSLIQELFSSPLVTNASATATSQAHGEVLAVSRRDHLCTALNVRLGLSDVCGVDALTLAQLKTPIVQIALGLPSDGYGRGAAAPVLPNQATLFYSAATENICTQLANQVIDPPANKQVAGSKSWSSGSPAPAIADFVSIVMGLPPSDPRSQPASDALMRHFQSAMSSSKNATTALRSTFITACLAPGAVSIGL